jgi:hypothetical protein
MNDMEKIVALQDPEILTYDSDELVFAPATIVTGLSDCDC